MKVHFFIHRNLYARGFGLTIVREGRLIFNFWLWSLSGCFYLGERFFMEESFQNRKLREADERAAKVERHRDALLTVAAYETRDETP